MAGMRALGRVVAASGAAAGLAAALGIGNEALRLMRRRQAADAYAVAVGLLGSPDVTVRVGGVHALGTLLADAPPSHDMVVRTLTALVREHAPARGADAGEDDYERPPGDVRAALAVLARRPRRGEAEPIDLSDTRLAGAELSEARLVGAVLFGAELHHADLSGADLTGAEIGHADLRGARLWEAHMPRADLSAARLDDADLTGADLREARIANASLRAAVLHGTRLEGATLAESDLHGATLDDAALDGAFLSRAKLHGTTFDGARMAGASLLGADLADADLSAAFGVTGAQLADARTGPTTKLPADL
ncbi:MAG TPA: pentapeptide repeat-containing protein [Streptosporangiaceae bacterium]|jgi:uncharacterized protein YjbI with pentapeptide repeats